MFWRKKRKPPAPSAGEIIIQNIYANGYAFEVQEQERLFADALGQQLLAAGLLPQSIMLERMAWGGFNVYYGAGLYVGKICLRILPDKWAVKRAGATRASRVFDTKDAAEAYAAGRQGYEIERREGGQLCAMRYLRGLYTVKDMESPTFEECVAAIPRWITYIQKQSAAMRRALKP